MKDIADIVTETSADVDDQKLVLRPTPELSLYYASKSSFVDQEGIMVLTEWLMNTAPGKALGIIGYSDNRGADEENQRMAHLRAHFVKWFIEKYFSHKDLVLSTGHVVVDFSGNGHNKVELYYTLDNSPAESSGSRR